MTFFELNFEYRVYWVCKTETKLIFTCIFRRGTSTKDLKKVLWSSHLLFATHQLFFACHLRTFSGLQTCCGSFLENISKRWICLLLRFSYLNMADFRLIVGCGMVGIVRCVSVKIEQWRSVSKTVVLFTYGFSAATTANNWKTCVSREGVKQVPKMELCLSTIYHYVCWKTYKMRWVFQPRYQNSIYLICLIAFDV